MSSPAAVPSAGGAAGASQAPGRVRSRVAPPLPVLGKGEPAAALPRPNAFVPLSSDPMPRSARFGELVPFAEERGVTAVGPVRPPVAPSTLPHPPHPRFFTAVGGGGRGGDVALAVVGGGAGVRPWVPAPGRVPRGRRACPARLSVATRLPAGVPGPLPFPRPGLRRCPGPAGARSVREGETPRQEEEGVGKSGREGGERAARARDGGEKREEEEERRRRGFREGAQVANPTLAPPPPPPAASAPSAASAGRFFFPSPWPTAPPACTPGAVRPRFRSPRRPR